MWHITVFLVKQLLDLLSKNHFLSQAIDVVVVCQHTGEREC